MVKNTGWPDESATQACALSMAKCPAVANAIIELHGDLGAGKTTWVRHLLRALGVSGRIKSPSYGVVEPHQGVFQGQDLSIWHFDFYRFSDPREWVDAGLRDLFTQAGLKLVEWPQQAGPVRPQADLAVHIESLDDEQRQVTWHAMTTTGLSLLEAA
ncbi:MAG: tRNA (adenosine(37)-N6)-threonylcarbamoyltransferase complex ATPase subunit type 1 TsaE [Alphaproteobacteria bacterium]|nr:tRNA (adenosine(37)-N6)-threonylcarbamoyltransferase complex ATPase subunit type 1 TsaE [Alphaproteobacteria bacterium]